VKRHKQNPQNKELHRVIEAKEGDESLFNKVIKEATKHEPFDKKK